MGNWGGKYHHPNNQTNAYQTLRLSSRKVSHSYHLISSHLISFLPLTTPSLIIPTSPPFIHQLPPKIKARVKSKIPNHNYTLPPPIQSQRYPIPDPKIQNTPNRSRNPIPPIACTKILLHPIPSHPIPYTPSHASYS